MPLASPANAPGPAPQPRWQPCAEGAGPRACLAVTPRTFVSPDVCIIDPSVLTLCFYCNKAFGKPDDCLKVASLADGKAINSQFGFQWNDSRAIRLLLSQEFEQTVIFLFYFSLFSWNRGEQMYVQINTQIKFLWQLAVIQRSQRISLRRPLSQASDWVYRN